MGYRQSHFDKKVVFRTVAKVIIHGLEEDLGIAVSCELGSEKARFTIEDLSMKGLRNDALT